MDFMKQKSSTSNSNGKRFHTVDIYSESLDPSQIGILPSHSDTQFANPSLDNCEKVKLVMSNCFQGQQTSLEVNITWNPDACESRESVNSKLVTFATSLQLCHKNQVYTYSEIETYQHDNMKRYGSPGSALKFTINSAYRRLRLHFRGYMKLVSGVEDQEDADVMVRFGIVINPTSFIYDFNCKENMKKIKNQLFLHDKHEYLIRCAGDLVIGTGSSASTSDLTLWGFHSKSYLKENDIEKKINSKHIRLHLQNGQAFHIGTRYTGEDGKKQQVQVGYICLKISPLVENADSVDIEWDKITEETENFGLKVSGQTVKLSIDAKRLRKSSNVYAVDIEDYGPIKGWAFVTFNEDNFDNKDAMLKCMNYYKTRLSKGLTFERKSFHSLQSSRFERPSVVSLADPRCVCTDLVGAKASSLAELKKFSSSLKNHEYSSKKNLTYDVTNAVVLTCFAYDKFVEHNFSILWPQIETLNVLLGSEISSQDSESDQQTSIRECCNKLMSSFKQAQFPNDLAKELEKTLRETFVEDGKDVPIESVSFAVRSSSWGEDGEEMSAAGQLTTELNIKGELDKIIESVKVCFGSKFSYENASYKRAHGLSPSLPMAVIIQQMVLCHSAGVIFTNNLAGDPRQALITANYGLGETVVSGQAEPDQIWVSFSEKSVADHTGAEANELLEVDAKISTMNIGSKETVIYYDESNGSERTNLDRNACCLAEHEILRLALVGRAIAQYFCSPRDIEWGYSQTGRLYMFQARPITSSDLLSEREILHEEDRMTRAEIEFATRANVGEVLPFAISPLELTCNMKYWYSYMAHLNRLFLGKVPDIHPDLPMNFFFGSYHAFLGLRGNQFFPIREAGEEKSLMTRSMELSLFGKELDDQPQIVEASKNIPLLESYGVDLKFRLKTLDMQVARMYTITKAKNRLVSERKAIEKYIEDATSSSKVRVQREAKFLVDYCYKKILQVQRLGRQAFGNHMIATLLSDNDNFILQNYLSNFFKNPVEIVSCMNKFLGACKVLSGEIPRRIKKIASLVISQGQDQLDKFLAMPANESIEYLKKNNHEYREFIEKFGHRCYHEFDVSSIRWREDEIAIVDMVKLNCRQTSIDTKTESTSATCIDDSNAPSNGALNNEQNNDDEDIGVKSEQLENDPNNDEIIKSIGLTNRLTWFQKIHLKSLASKSQYSVRAREMTKDCAVYLSDFLRMIFVHLAKQLRRLLRIPDENLIFYLFFEELGLLVDDAQPEIVAKATYRRSVHRRLFDKPWNYEEIIDGPELSPVPDRQFDEAARNAPRLEGTPASFGKAKGKVCIVDGLSELQKVKQGDILVTHSTDIAFSPVFPLISGLVTEVGGLISHGAVVAREYGLPCLLAVPNATKALDDGEQVLLDADKGHLIRLSKQVENS